MPSHLVRAALVAPLATIALLTPAAAPVAHPVWGLVHAPTAPGAPVDPGDARHGSRVGDYTAPVPGTVVGPFDPPAQKWARGHRGVDLAAAAGEAVGAPNAGIVSFSGRVGGRPVVVVTHRDGLRSTLEPVAGSVARGSTVARGQVVGTLASVPSTASSPGHCAPDDCLHWGVRRGETYLDPLALLGSAPPIVLLPLSAAP